MDYEFTKPPFGLSGLSMGAKADRSEAEDGKRTIQSSQPGSNPEEPRDYSPDDLWECYQNHRDIVTRSILSQRKADGESLVILGTGQCLDLDLPQLSEQFATVKLVDIIESSEGIQRQGVSGKNVEFIGGVDVCGVFEMLGTYRQSPSRRLLDDIIHKAGDFILAMNIKSDVVVSTCLLSQIINHAYESVGLEEHRFIELLTTLRHQHLKILIEMLKPGGRGVLVTDFVASSSLPELKTAKVNELQQILAKAIVEKNYFHGLNPKRVHAVFAEEGIGEQLTSVKLSSPWRWIATPDLVYACFALIFEKSAASAEPAG